MNSLIILSLISFIIGFFLALYGFKSTKDHHIISGFFLLGMSVAYVFSFAIITSSKNPQPLDVYRGKTDLVVDRVSGDSLVVWKTDPHYILAE